jgi:hypothetical protein
MNTVYKSTIDVVRLSWKLFIFVYILLVFLIQKNDMI